MSNTKKRIDTQACLDFEARVEAYVEARAEVLEACQAPMPQKPESAEEATIEIAAAIKRSLAATNMSREELVDAINIYHGRTGKRALSIHMLNNYLSKPRQYPIPAYYLLTIQVVTDSLEPSRVLAESMGARVVSREQVRQMALGKLDETIDEMRRLKRELKGARSF